MVTPAASLRQGGEQPVASVQVSRVILSCGGLRIVLRCPIVCIGGLSGPKASSSIDAGSGRLSGPKASSSITPLSLSWLTVDRPSARLPSPGHHPSFFSNSGEALATGVLKMAVACCCCVGVLFGMVFVLFGVVPFGGR